MKYELLNVNGEKIKDLNLDKEVFGIEPNDVNYIFISHFHADHICGLKDFTNIADFMKLKEDYFTKLLNLENGTPSHDCLSDLYASIDPKQFMKIFIEWTKDILEKKTGKKISIDGKAIKSATDKINNGNIPYIVSAFIGEIGLSIGEVKVDDKSNEITAIPELLDLLDIEGATITIDAIGT